MNMLAPINLKILRVAYNQYFCNTAELTDKQLLTLHFNYVTMINQDEDLEFYEIDDDLIIWEPFEDLCPAKVLENIESLITDIETNVLPTHAILVNPLELASELAHNRLLETTEETALWEEDKNGDFNYKDEYQDEFNEYFDYYYNVVKEH